MTEDKILIQIKDDLATVISTIKKLKSGNIEKRHANIAYLHDMLSKIENTVLKNTGIK